MRRLALLAAALTAGLPALAAPAHAAPAKPDPPAAEPTYACVGGATSGIGSAPLRVTGDSCLPGPGAPARGQLFRPFRITTESRGDYVCHGASLAPNESDPTGRHIHVFAFGCASAKPKTGR
ncbi:MULTISPECIES: hypothetical protein [Actinomadura]|uniref:Uncharacterized protein n=1 Tax=Actinomadura yumaensis TaxID=111807 RepID=A0ABW2CMS2_9ACTN|nr:hypothetical protein [Actinomadura sp. J1-007]MWK36902.1 hypothetical protein [Actinomadura sp. J1-007]